MAKRNILAGRTDIGAGPQAGGQHDVTFLDPDVFLHEDGIGPFRHRRAGEDPHRLTGFDRRLRRGAGLHAPGNGKCLLLVQRQVAACDRIAVNRGIGERRQRQRRGDVAREDAAVGGSKCNSLGLLNRLDPCRDDGDGLIDRHHRPAKGKAIVGQLRHLADQTSLFANTSSTGIADLLSNAATASTSSRWAVGSVVSTLVSVAIPTTSGSSGNSSGLPLAARCTSILRCGSRLKPSTMTRSTGDIFARSFGSRGSAAPRNSCIRAQRRVEDTSTSVAPDWRCTQESLPGTSTSNSWWACLITETRRPSLSKCGITRFKSVVLPAPLHPASPISFISFSAANRRNRA